MRRRRIEDKEVTAKGEENSQGMAGLLNNLNIETGGNEEEAAEGLEAALGMEVKEDGECGGASKGVMGLQVHWDPLSTSIRM